MGQTALPTSCEVAIIGTGPYGLSVAAHLRATGVKFRIFGKPMELWRSHMPKSMMLKSNGFASNLSAPDRHSTLKDFCRQQGRAYSDLNFPIALTDFVDYADWFRARHVPDLEEVMVTGLERSGEGFLLTLDTGERVRAGRVVLAVGITWFAHMPDELAALPAGMISHSFDHRTVDQFRDRDVVVVGAGASAVNLAYELKEAGARAQLLARGEHIEYHNPPDPRAASLGETLRNPPSPIGQGWRSLLCARLPRIFYRLPAHLRARALRSHLRPAAGWFMRDKVLDQVPHLVRRGIAKAVPENGRVRLYLTNGEEIVCDHVIAATGYRVALSRLGFVSDALRQELTRADCNLHVSPGFETDVKGLYAVGPLAIENFGPLLRFMVGAEFAAPRLARILARSVFIARAGNIARAAANILLGRPRAPRFEFP